MPRHLSLVAIGLLAGLTLTAQPASPSVFRIDNPSPSANAGFGTGIAGLGDQNGDGIPDFAVGVPGADRVDIISGADRTVIRSLHDPEGLPGFQFGFAVAGIGDVNGDGVEDIAVGAPGPMGGLLPLPCDPMFDTCPRPEWGRVFLFSGATGAMIRKIVPSSPDFLAFGLSLAPLGDVNGDGVPDLAAGSPVLLPNKWGEVYAFSGATGAQIWLFQEPPHPMGAQAIASLGEFLAPVGDLNGDGRRDLLAAAPFHDNSGTGTVLGGKVFVLSGASGAVIRSHQAAAPVDSGFFGGKVSAIGDQNSDGVEDYVIGHRGGSEILLYSGATGGLIRAVPSPADPADGLLALARAGDRDGDGREDFWVGVVPADVVHLLNGHGASLLHVNDPGAAPANAFQRFGSSVARVADLNGDGKSEVLIGKPGETVSGHAGAGTVFLVTSNRPPIADAGQDRTVAADASCAATVTLNGAGSSDPDGDTLTYLWTGPFGTVAGVNPAVALPLGQHTITLLVDDGHGATDSDTVVVTVADQSAPAITSIVASPDTLWPPDHTMRPVTIAVLASDNCDAAPVCRIVSVASNEPENGLGDGDTGPDFAVTGDLTLNLRAERSGSGSGRIYAIAVACFDFSGNRSGGSVQVAVPTAKGK